MLRAELAVPEMFRCTTRSLFDVVPRAMSWIWQGWIPQGCLSAILGEPGVGKSLCALQLAAMVTRGWSALPISPEQTELSQAVNAGGISGAGGTVVLFDAGDGASILRSRLEAAGADIAKIVLVERNWRNDSPDEEEEFLQSEPRKPQQRPTRLDRDRELRRDLESLEQHVVQLRQAGHDVSLVLIDPIESLLRDAVDKHRLARLLSRLAESLNVAIVAVGTTSSTPRAYPGLRLDVKGIDAFFKASKTVITVVRDPEDDLRRMVVPTKLNLSASPPGLTFAFDASGAIAWSESVTSLAEQESRDQCTSPVEREPSRELGRAMSWLKERLSDGGVPVTTLRSDAREHDISRASLRRAYDQLGCLSKKSLGSGRWVWRLPGSVEDVEDFNIGTDLIAERNQDADSSGMIERVNETCSTADR